MRTLPIERLLGEGSHGTHELYRIRAELTQALIRSRGFTLVAKERGPEAALGQP